VEQPLSRFARIGIIHPMLWPEVASGEGPILQTLQRLVADTFFQAVELTTIADEQTRMAARRLCETARVAVAFAAQPILLGGRLSLNDHDAAARARAVEAAKQAVNQAHSLGAEACAVLSGPDPGPADRPRATDLLVDSLKWLCDYSAQKGNVRVELETFDRKPFGKNCLIGPNDEAAEVARKVRAQFPSFGLLVDLSHLPLQEESPRQAVRAVADFLTHAHIGNCVIQDPAHEAYGDAHPRLGIPGGENDIPQVAEFLRELLDCGFLDPEQRPIVSFEVKPLSGESVEALIAGSKRTLLEAWRLA